MKIINFLSRCICIIAAGVYLTNFIETYSLIASINYWSLFLAVCIVLTTSAYATKTWIKIPSNIVLLASIVISAGLLLTYQSVLLPTPQHQKLFITLKAVQDGKASATGEVWLTNIVIDGENVPLSQLTVKEKLNWLYKKEYDDYVYYPNKSFKDNVLAFQVEAQNVEMTFGTNTWSGKVQITDTKGVCETINLYTEQKNVDNLKYLIHKHSLYTVLEKGTYQFGALVVFSFILQLLISQFLSRICPLSENGHKRHISLAFMIFYLLIAIILFGTSPLIMPSLATKAFLLGLTLTSSVVCNMGWSEACMEKYKTKGKIILLCCIALYSSLATFAYRFFLFGNVRPSFSLNGLGYILLGTLWYIPLIFMMLFAMETLAARSKPEMIREHRRRDFFILLSVLCACEAVILWAFWPGGFPPDTTDQFAQAIGNAKLTDWHPVLHTLLFRLIYTVIPLPGAITAAQMFVFAVLTSMILMIGYDHGVKLSWLCVIGSLFLLLPNQVFSVISTVKDFPYMLALLWATYLLFKLAIKDKSCLSARFLIYLAIDMFLIFGLRHNGIIPFLAIGISCACITVCNFSFIKYRLILSVITAVLMTLLYKGPIFTMLNVSANTYSIYTPMLCAVGSCVNKNLALSEKTNTILTGIIPLSDWRDYYSRFQGHDRYVWGRGKGKSFDTTHIKAKEAFSVYLEALRKYPDVVIKDRFDGTNILWDITQPEDAVSSKAHDVICIVTPELEKVFATKKLARNNWGAFYNKSQIAELYRKSLNTNKCCILNSFLWRSGIYIVLLFVLMLFWWKNQMKCMCWSLAPVIANILGLIFASSCQDFRYVYFVQVITAALFFISICVRNMLRNNQRYCNKAYFNQREVKI